jgi:hypothetical protein
MFSEVKSLFSNPEYVKLFVAFGLVSLVKPILSSEFLFDCSFFPVYLSLLERFMARSHSLDNCPPITAIQKLVMRLL